MLDRDYRKSERERGKRKKTAAIAGWVGGWLAADKNSSWLISLHLNIEFKTHAPTNPLTYTHTR